MKNKGDCAGQICPCRDLCPLKSALEKIGGKWKLQIICALMQDGTTRYGELKRKIDKITNTALAGALKDLEADGLVSRMQYPEVPMRVEYTVTDRCQSLMPILKQLIAWESALQ